MQDNRVRQAPKDGNRVEAVSTGTTSAGLRPELLAQWDHAKNSMEPSAISIGSHNMVWWRCEKGHSWQARMFSRTREKVAGCPYCTGKKALPGYNDLASLRPDLAFQWHRGLNGSLTPDQITLGSNKRVWWRCGEGHVWLAAVYSRTRTKGAGCPVCAGMVRYRGEEAMIASDDENET